jgi:rod shape-determining protein MreC
MEERVFTQARAFAQSRKPYRGTHSIRLGFFTCIGFILLALNHLRPAEVYDIRRHLNDAIFLSLDWLGRPLAILEKKIFHLQNFITNIHRLQELEYHFQELEIWQHRARQFQHENQKLRESLRYVKRELPVVATVRAFFSFDGRYLQSMMVEAGEAEGIQLNQPVIAYGRLIGRIIEVSPHSSRVLLITDLHSRIPIETEWSHLRGILTGTNSKRLAFLHEREKKDLLEGELVFTTGEGGILPSGYLIGKLVVTEQEEIFVDPGIEWRKIDIVQILKLPEEVANDPPHQEKNPEK